MRLMECLVFFFLVSGALAACPQTPVSCRADQDYRLYGYDCEVINYRGKFEEDIPCKVAKAAFPRTEAELLEVVADGVRSHSKMKVTTLGSHSISRLACPGTNHNDNNTLVISTAHYNSRITVDRKEMTVTADSGVELRLLLEELSSHGLAMPQAINWDSLSVAGMVSTGSHGSGLWGKGGGIHDHVVSISLVVPASSHEGYSKLVILGPNDEGLKAARLSLGVLGVISQVTFTVEKMFKRSVTAHLKDDHNLQSIIVDFARTNEFGSVEWYPSVNKVTLLIKDRVDVNVPGNGSWQHPAFVPLTVEQTEQIRAAEEQSYVSGNLSAICSVVAVNTLQNAHGYLNDEGKFTGYPVIGYNHKIQASSGCQINPQQDQSCPRDLKGTDLICGWNTQVKGMFYFHTSVGIPLAVLPEAINDIKKLRNMYRSHFCGIDLYLGFQIRFIKKSENYLGQRQDTAQIEFFSFRHRQGGEPRVNEHVFEEVEQILLFKYGGIPHFGKNRVLAFIGVPGKVVNINKFLKFKQKFDKEGLFSSEWSDRILGIVKAVEVFKEGCAVDGLCVCREDKHCAPHKGYFCSPGAVWKKARVCRKASIQRFDYFEYRQDTCLL